jgi:hypothetical protein
LRLCKSFGTHGKNNNKKTMRTKALFVAAAFGAAGLVSSMAQVYSVNVVGYVNKALLPGFNLISNPLDATSNAVEDLFPPVDGLSVYKYDSATGTYMIASYLALFSQWTGDAFDVAPGEGVFVRNPQATDLTVTFVGEITAGTKSIGVPQGFSMRSSIIPEEGALVTDLGWPQADGDTVYMFDAGKQDYDIFSYLALFTAWSPSEPVLGVGDAFFVNKPAASTWTREFIVGE